MYKLIIFDADGTLCDRDTGELLPGVFERIAETENIANLAIATNQGGVGLRYWMETDGFGDPSKYPTQREVRRRYADLGMMIENIRFIQFDRVPVYYSFAYQSKSSGKWGPVPSDSNEWRQDWRKPSPGMLIAAMGDANVSPSDTLFIGDRDEDMQAAQAAGCNFMWAQDWIERGIA